MATALDGVGTENEIVASNRNVYGEQHGDGQMVRFPTNQRNLFSHCSMGCFKPKVYRIAFVFEQRSSFISTHFIGSQDNFKHIQDTFTLSFTDDHSLSRCALRQVQLFFAKVMRCATESEVKALFSKFGTVMEVNLFRAFQGAPTTKVQGRVVEM
jgi:hypothetical protein